jgi:hypothetical protein
MPPLTGCINVHDHLFGTCRLGATPSVRSTEFHCRLPGGGCSVVIHVHDPEVSIDLIWLLQSIPAVTASGSFGAFLNCDKRRNMTEL